MRSRWIAGANSSVKRRGDGLHQRAFAHERHVGLHGKARGRQRPAHGSDVLAVEPEGVGEHQPALDAAFLAAGAIVVENAMHPFAAQLAVVHPADEGGVLARHAGLVAVAVESPGLHLALVELAAVQKAMEGMLVVVALGADRADGRLQLLGCE